MPKDTDADTPSNSEVALCADCCIEESDQVSLTWTMRKQEVNIESIEEFEYWMERHEGKATVVIVPDEGDIACYTAAPRCDNCLSDHLRQYEEVHTPVDKTTRAELMEQVLAELDDPDWHRFVLTTEHLAPMGIPNLVLKKKGRLHLVMLRGDTAARMRRGWMPAGTVIVSPEVPKAVADAWLGTTRSRELGDSIAFLYMDEKYMDGGAPPEMRATSLTGLLVPADAIVEFRSRFLKLLPDFDEGSMAYETDIHATDLFRNHDDVIRFGFLDGLVSLANELDCGVYRRGFTLAGDWQPEAGDEAALLRQCFLSILIDVAEFETSSQVWPVMETDHSDLQDRNFAGFGRWMEHATTYLDELGDGVENLIDDEYMVDISRFGEVHYVTKRSVMGNAVDCLAYILHAKWLVDRGFVVSEHKARLAEIGSKLKGSNLHDYVGTYELARD